jgi:L-amino acid N-acyltransferase YncA
MTRCIHVLGTLSLILLVFGMDVRAADVPYLSGGVGADAREELLAKEKEYNLKIVVAERSGDYLAGVKVVIESARKEPVLDTTMEGPILLAKLAPGTYTIRAVNDGQTLTRTVTVPAQGLGRVDLRWSMIK